MGSLVQLTRRSGLAPIPHHRTRMVLLQLDLVLDDVRLRGMTAAERQAALRAIARLLLEAGGAAREEVGDDNA
jgi:hypothetical protein